MGKKTLAVGHAPRRGGPAHQLRVSTCLSGTAAALLIGVVPATARPVPAMTLSPVASVETRSRAVAAAQTLPVDLTIHRDTARRAPSPAAKPFGLRVGGTPDARKPITAPVHDLTALPPARAVTMISGDDVVIDAGDVSTTGDGVAGIDTVATRSTTISADKVATAGARAAGVHASGNGPITIDVGSVTTTGDHADGIYALTGAGSVTISANSVSTSGFLSDGIRAASYSGDVTVDVGTVTGGVGTGIDVRAGYGDHGTATITAGTIVTDGAGIVALAGNAIKIDVDSVTTHSGTEDAGTQLGQAIRAVGHGDIDIRAGTVATTGYWAEGITAVSSASGDGRPAGNITIDAGSVATTGFKSNGIYANSTGYLDGGSQLVSIKAGSVSTVGDLASGIYAVGPNVTIAANGAISTRGDLATGIYAASLGGDTNVTAGDISTSGFLSSGVRAFSAGGKVTITTSGAIHTAGTNSYGVLAFGSADLTVTNSGSVSTEGAFGRGIYAITGTGAISVSNSGTISTSGLLAEGIRAVTGTQGVSVTSTGKIVTTGDYSAGIIAGRDRSRRGDREMAAVGASPLVTVSAADVETSGKGSNGVVAVNYALGGTTVVNVDKVTSMGEFSIGIASATFGDIAITAGQVRSAGQAIFAQTAGDHTQTITITGSAVSTGNTAIQASQSYGRSIVNIAKNAQVIGGGHRDPVYGGGGDGILLDIFGGTATVNNAGTISTAANGYAIEASAARNDAGEATSQITINNTGTILGAVRLSAGADTMNNGGVMVATKDSDFGGGGDRFVNTGTLMIAPGSAPGRVAFDNLAIFRNQGGLIDFRNGAAGDVLRLSGDFVGSSGSMLAIDVSGGKADRLEVVGPATGKTSILLKIADKEAGLLLAPVTLVTAGKGSATDAFSIANADIGLVHYGIRYDAGAGSYGLASGAGASVYRMLTIPRAAEALWHRAGDAWDAQMGDKRDRRGVGGDGFGSRVWGQAYAGVETQDAQRSLDSNRIDTGFRQDFFGAQIGYDVAGTTSDTGGTLFGLTGSYLSSRLNGRGNADRTRIDAVQLGAYASFLTGPVFANVLAQYGHDRIRTSNATLGYSDRLDGDSYGATLQLGARFGADTFYLEPSASLAYVRSSIDDLHALGQVIDFDSRNGLRGKLGARLGSTLDMPRGGKAIVYLRMNYVHEFKGENGLVFLSGGASQSVSGARNADYGHGALGVNILSAGRVSGFFEGDADFGGGTRGGGGRVGLSFKL